MLEPQERLPERKNDIHEETLVSEDDKRSFLSRMKCVLGSIAFVGLIKALVKLVLFFYDLASKLSHYTYFLTIYDLIKVTD